MEPTVPWMLVMMVMGTGLLSPEPARSFTQSALRTGAAVSALRMGPSAQVVPLGGPVGIRPQPKPSPPANP